MFFDTHTHLDFPDYDADRDNVIARAKANSIDNIIAIGAGTSLEGNKHAIELAQSHDLIYASVGIHPHDSNSMNGTTIDTLKKLAEHPKVVAIGEIGLDFYHKHSPPEIQKQRFAELIELAIEINLPIIIHSRDAYNEVLDILKANKVEKVGGVFHCFSGDLKIAKKCLDLGFYLSFAGVVTFKNAKTTIEVINNIPVERMLLETDCPFLAPEPFRGKRNEPSYLPHIAERIAKLKSLTVGDVARITTHNAKRFFRIGTQEHGAIAYAIRNSLYLNITNRCTNACVFCPKFRDFIVKGHYLKLKNEPTEDDIIKAMGDISKYGEVVFCGFGEPTLRLEVVKNISKYLKNNTKVVRMDTDGLANLVHKRNILPDLAGLVDSISISLNAADPETYSKICPSKYKEQAYYAVKEFIKEAKKHIAEVTATIVAMPQIDVEACRTIAEKELGVKFRSREYNEVG